MNPLLELRRRHAQLIEQAEDLANGELTNETRSQIDDLLEEARTVRADIERLEEMEGARRGSPRPEPGTQEELGLSDEERRSYSFLRAIRGQVTGNWEQAGLEREASVAAAQARGLPMPEENHVYIPFDVLGGEGSVQVRSRNGSWRYEARHDAADPQLDTTAGAALIETELRAQDFIDLLRNQMVLQQAGARVLRGLVGNVDIPRQTSGASMEWKAEDGETTESSPGFDTVSLEPHTGSAATYLTRKQIMQSSLDMENLVRDDLAQCLSIGIDSVGLYGTGLSNQPLGVAGTSGIHVTAESAPDWDGVVDFETGIASDNAAMGRLAYITSSKMRGYWKTTPKVSGQDRFIWAGGNTPVNEYPAYITNQVPDNLGVGTDETGLFFGNWGDLLMGFWGSLDLLVDPYSYSRRGGILIVAHLDVDVAVRRAVSFAYKSFAI